MTTDDLLWRWLERPESLDAEAMTRLHQALSTDPALMARARRHLHLDEIIARTIDPARQCFLASVRERFSPVRRIHRPRRLNLLWFSSAAVAAGLLIGFGLIWNVQRNAPPPAARLDDGTTVAAGGEVVAKDHAIELTLSDGSWLKLDRGSAVRLGSATAAHELLSGAVTAEVAARSYPPFIIRTADGSATVLGTRFRMSNRSAGTDLEVERGLVALASDFGTVLVSAGRHGRIAVGHPPELLPLLQCWTFESGALPTELTSGTAFLDPGHGNCLRGTRYHEATNSLGLLAIANHGLTRCVTGAELSFDYRITSDDGAPLYVWIQGADGSQWHLPIVRATGSGWHHIVVPLARLNAVDDPTRNPPVDMLVTHLATGIRDGPDHEVLLDNVTMPEP